MELNTLLILLAFIGFCLLALLIGGVFYIWYTLEAMLIFFKRFGMDLIIRRSSNLDSSIANQNPQRDDD
jgi:hypothetical protein